MAIKGLFFVVIIMGGLAENLLALDLFGEITLVEMEAGLPFLTLAEAEVFH